MRVVMNAFFAAADALFPHDSTGNQFFSEARFESYRALGFHTVLSVAPAIGVVFLRHW